MKGKTTKQGKNNLNIKHARKMTYTSLKIHKQTFKTLQKEKEKVKNSEKGLFCEYEKCYEKKFK